MLPRRYTLRPASRTRPDTTWYVFDTHACPWRTVAICESATDAINVRAGLEMLEANKQLVQEVFGVPV